MVESLKLRPEINRGRQLLSTTMRSRSSPPAPQDDFYTRFFADHPDLTEKVAASEEMLRVKWMTQTCEEAAPPRLVALLVSGYQRVGYIGLLGGHLCMQVLPEEKNMWSEKVTIQTYAGTTHTSRVVWPRAAKTSFLLQGSPTAATSLVRPPLPCQGFGHSSELITRRASMIVPLGDSSPAFFSVSPSRVKCSCPRSWTRARRQRRRLPPPWRCRRRRRRTETRRHRRVRRQLAPRRRPPTRRRPSRQRSGRVARMCGWRRNERRGEPRERRERCTAVARDP